MWNGGMFYKIMEEVFDIVDENGNIIRTATRSECHRNPALIHQVVHLHVFDTQGRLYLQKRSQAKDLLPGYWDAAVGGHIGSGEDVGTALRREAEEELGINADEACFLYNYLWHGINETEYVHSFSLVYSGTVHPNPEEVEEGRFFPLEEIKAKVGMNFLTPNFEFEYIHYLEKLVR